MASQETLKTFDKYYYETYQDTLTFVVCNCPNIEDAKDIVQNTYLELYKKIEKNELINNPKSYILAIAKHKIKDYYRFKYKTKLISLFSNYQDKDLLETYPANIDIENMILTKDTLDKAWNYLKKKKSIIPKVFYLYYYNNLTIKEIAKTLNLTESNVKHYLYRTIEELNIYLKEETNEGKK